MDLALNNQQLLMCYKTKQTKQITYDLLQIELIVFDKNVWTI